MPALLPQMMLVLRPDGVHHAQDQAEDDVDDAHGDGDEHERLDRVDAVERQGDRSDRDGLDPVEVALTKHVAEELPIQESEDDDHRRRRSQNRRRDLHHLVVAELAAQPDDDAQHDRAVADVADDHAEEQREEQEQEDRRVERAVARHAVHAEQALERRDARVVLQRDRRVGEVAPRRSRSARR